ncbi:MAG: HigA family addiction module antitoxin [Xanthomonadales bacterium]|nr:HigA family addiction module antitoxin [Xanthomonadales bacterium]
MAGDTDLTGLEPMHPGELLREDILPALGISKTAVAEHLGISRTTLYELLNEETPVTPQLALRLGKLCGNGPKLWLNLQQDYDLRTLEAADGAGFGSDFHLVGVTDAAVGARSTFGRPAPGKRDYGVVREQANRCGLFTVVMDSLWSRSELQ